MKKTFALVLALLTLALSAGTAYADVIKMDIPYQNNDPSLYLVELDLTNQIGTIYQRDGMGGYSTIVRQFLITSGNPENQTPTGTFKLTEMRERFGYFLNFNIYAQYWTQIVRGIYIHSVLFSKRNDKSMTSKSYRELGSAVSHGCVRMLVEDARFIYYNCPPGTTIKITKKAKNAELAKSLKPKASASKYKFETDTIPAVEPVKAYIINDGVPLRTGFSLGAHEIDKTLATLNAGDEIEILQSGKSWVKARIGKKEGYLQTKHVRAANPLDSVQSTTFVTAQNAPVYIAGSNTSAVIGTLPYGTIVSVLEDSFTYFKYINANGLTGYVLKDDLMTLQGTGADDLSALIPPTDTMATYVVPNASTDAATDAPADAAIPSAPTP